MPGNNQNRHYAKRTRTEATTEDPGEIQNLGGLDGPVCKNTGADGSCVAERYDLAKQLYRHDANDE